MFELKEPTTVTLVKSTPHKEHHGDKLHQALSLRLRWQTNNRALDEIAPGLRAALFGKPLKQPKPQEGQAKMDLPVDELPRLLFPSMKQPLKFDDEFAGHTLRVDYGLGGDADLVLQTCKLTKFEASGIDGGSCDIEWSVSSSVGIDENLIGKFGVLEQSQLKITMLAPADVQGGAIDGTKGHEGAASKGKKAKDATELFSEANA
jgi:hypothetical protein